MRRSPPAFLLSCIGLLCSYAGAAAQGVAVDPIAAARDQFRSELMIEASGVFWIAAEVAILFCMTAAVRIFATRPLPSRISLTRKERRRAIAWAIGMGALVAATFGRHLFIAPLPEAYSAIAAAGRDARLLAEQAYALRTHIHITLWCAFITAWVVLEIAIVVQGIRAYKNLKGLITNG